MTHTSRLAELISVLPQRAYWGFWFAWIVWFVTLLVPISACMVPQNNEAHY